MKDFFRAKAKVIPGNLSSEEGLIKLLKDVDSTTDRWGECSRASREEFRSPAARLQQIESFFLLAPSMPELF